MPAPTFTSELGNLLYRQFGELINPVSPSDVLAKDIPFVEAEKQQGELYVVPLRLGLENAVTFANTHDAYQLNPQFAANAADYEQAQLRGSEMTVRANISYAEMKSLSPNKGKSSRASDQAVGVKIVNTSDSAVQKRDMNLMYGAGSSGLTSIGQISSIALAPAAPTATVTATIQRGSYIPGFWQEAKGVMLDVFRGATQLNVAGSPVFVTGVNRDAGQVTLQCAAWTTTAGNWAAGAGQLDLFFFGSRVVSMVGLQGIATNSTSLFNVDASIYPQWRSVQYSCAAGPLTFDKVAEGLSGVSDNGLSDGITLYVAPRTWTDLMTDEAALRRRIDKDKTARTGYNKLAFDMNCGPVEIKSYKYMKQGIALAVPTQEAYRIGAGDISFSAPGHPNKYFWSELGDANGAQIRCYSDQAVFVENPSHMCLFTSIVSSADIAPVAQAVVYT